MKIIFNINIKSDKIAKLRRGLQLMDSKAEVGILRLHRTHLLKFAFRVPGSRD